MPRKWFKRYLPDPATLAANRWLAWMGPRLHDPQLWTLHRRNVARAVAVGLFAGLMPGPTQMLTAGALAWCWRINLPVALATTLYTNPLTIVPLYWLAYEYGCLLTGQQGGLPALPPEWAMQGFGVWLGQMVDWAQSLGWPLLLGVPALGLTLGLAGHGLVMLAWRWHTVHAWRHRRHARKTSHGSD